LPSTQKFNPSFDFHAIKKYQALVSRLPDPQQFLPRPNRGRAGPCKATLSLLQYRLPIIWLSCFGSFHHEYDQPLIPLPW
jgi:hypothetical protein